MVQAKTQEARQAIGAALGLLNKSQGGNNAGAKQTGLLPTAKTRKALDLLMRSTPEKLLSDQVDLRAVATDLFNWKDDKVNRVNKVLIRRMNEALNTEGKYSHAVELIAYMSAVSPLFDADRLATLFDAMDEVESSFAPARFTIQLAHLMEPILSKYPTQRVQKLCVSMWVDAHKGQWWNMVAQDAADAAADDEEAPGPDLDDEMLDMFLNGALHFDRNTMDFMRRIPENEKVRTAIRNYVDKIEEGTNPNPDMAVLASNIPWLKSYERPESPVGPLVDSLVHLISILKDKFELPKKPTKFRDLYPPVSLYGAEDFPLPMLILARPEFYAGTSTMRFELVRNAIMLDENRKYMGNCTGSYRSQMENGTYALYRIHHTTNLGKETHIYNASMRIGDRGATYGEINSRFNRGNVPQNVLDAFRNYIAELNKQKVQINTELVQYRKELAKAKKEAERQAA